MVDLVKSLRDLCGHLRDGTPLPDEERVALVVGLQDWLAARGEIGLDSALGLRSRGGVSPARAMALAERDDMLCRLWRSQLVWRDLVAIAAARMMVTSADRYETDRWPREQDSDAPAAEPAATWWYCLNRGVSVPDAKRLSQILSAAIAAGGSPADVRSIEGNSIPRLNFPPSDPSLPLTTTAEDRDMPDTPFNAHVKHDAPYTVPAGMTAEFHAFGVSTLVVDGVEIYNAIAVPQIGPIVASAGAVISTPHSKCGISGQLRDV